MPKPPRQPEPDEATRSRADRLRERRRAADREDAPMLLRNVLEMDLAADGIIDLDAGERLDVAVDGGVITLTIAKVHPSTDRLPQDLADASAIPRWRQVPEAPEPLDLAAHDGAPTVVPKAPLRETYAFHDRILDASFEIEYERDAATLRVRRGQLPGATGVRLTDPRTELTAELQPGPDAEFLTCRLTNVALRVEILRALQRCDVVVVVLVQAEHPCD